MHVLSIQSLAGVFHIFYQSSSEENLLKGRVGGHGLGGICDHINHFGSRIKEVCLLKA